MENANYKPKHLESDVEALNFSVPKHRSKAAVFFTVLFFVLCLPYQEVLLRLADPNITFVTLGLWRALLAAAALGMLFWLIGTVIPRKGIARAVEAILLGLSSGLYILERCCRAFFGSYFLLGFLTDMTNQVTGDFMSTVGIVIWKNLWYFPVSLAPFILFLIFRRTFLPKHPVHRALRPILQAAVSLSWNWPPSPCATSAGIPITIRWTLPPTARSPALAW